jgi:hypothetical protein
MGEQTGGLSGLPQQEPPQIAPIQKPTPEQETRAATTGKTEQVRGGVVLGKEQESQGKNLESVKTEQQRASESEVDKKLRTVSVPGFEDKKYELNDFDKEGLENAPVGSWVVRKSKSDQTLVILAIKVGTGSEDIGRTALTNVSRQAYEDLKTEGKKAKIDASLKQVCAKQVPPFEVPIASGGTFKLQSDGENYVLAIRGGTRSFAKQEYENLSLEKKLEYLTHACAELLEIDRMMPGATFQLRKSTSIPRDSVLSITIPSGELVRRLLGDYNEMESFRKLAELTKTCEELLHYLPKKGATVDDKPVGSWVVQEGSDSPTPYTLLLKVGETNQDIFRKPLPSNYGQLKWGQKKELISGWVSEEGIEKAKREMEITPYVPKQLLALGSKAGDWIVCRDKGECLLAVRRGDGGIDYQDLYDYEELDFEDQKEDVAKHLALIAKLQPKSLDQLEKIEGAWIVCKRPESDHLELAIRTKKGSDEIVYRPLANFESLSLAEKRAMIFEAAISTGIWTAIQCVPQEDESVTEFVKTLKSRLGSLPSSSTDLSKIVDRYEQVALLPTKDHGLYNFDILKLASFISIDLPILTSNTNTLYFKKHWHGLERTVVLDKERGEVYLLSKRKVDLLDTGGTYKSVTTSIALQSAKEAKLVAQSVSRSSAHAYHETLADLQIHKQVHKLPGIWPLYFVFEYQKDIKSLLKGDSKMPKVSALMPLADNNLHEVAENKKMGLEDISIAQEIGICFSLIQGVHSLHSVGIVHGDLKSANALKKGDMVGLCDFGFSFRPGDTTTPKRTITHYYGTVSFTPPEVFGNGDFHDKEGNFTGDFYKCDVWGLGCMLYELHFGKLPEWKRFPKACADGEMEIGNAQKMMNESIKKEIEEKFQTLSKVRSPTAVQALELLIYKMLRLNPNERIDINTAMSEISSIKGMNTS